MQRKKKAPKFKARVPSKWGRDRKEAKKQQRREQRRKRAAEKKG